MPWSITYKRILVTCPETDDVRALDLSEALVHLGREVELSKYCVTETYDGYALEYVGEDDSAEDA